jgi:hypothetical protein
MLTAVTLADGDVGLVSEAGDEFLPPQPSRGNVTNKARPMAMPARQLAASRSRVFAAAR